MFLFALACSSVLPRTLNMLQLARFNQNKRLSVLTSSKQTSVCPSLFYELNMRIKRVLGHTKRAVLACCERAITFIPVFLWRVTY